MELSPLNGISCPLTLWDGTGVVLVAKRLEDGEFRWPKIQDGALHLSAAQLSSLLEGLD